MNTNIIKSTLFLLFALLSTLSYGQTFDWETGTLNSSPAYPNLSASQVINGTYNITYRIENLGPVNLTTVSNGTSGLSVHNSQPHPTVYLFFYPALDIQSMKAYRGSNNQDWIFKSLDDNDNVINTANATVGTTANTVNLNWTNVRKMEITTLDGSSGFFGVDDIVFTPAVPVCNINIPNVNFKNYLLSNSSINTNGDSEIQCTEASSFTGAIVCDSYNIGDLTGIEAFTNLTSLNCANNNLSTLDITNNYALTYLDCSNNSLTNLDLYNNIDLTFLLCSSNYFQGLNVSFNSDLLSLSCDDNSLTSLDLQYNPSLVYLYCDNNALTKLDLSNNPSVVKLNCYRNDLTKLNVANGNNSNFTLFSAILNPNLTCVEVDNVAYSTANWTSLDAQASFSTSCYIPEPTVEMTDATTALFSWNAVFDATSYQVKYRLKNTTAWSTAGTSNTQRNVPNLTAKKYYQYKVRSQFTNGTWSDFSDIGLFYTSACDVPTGVASIYLDNTRMRIRWDNNPDEIKAKVRYREVGTSNWYTQNSADGNNYIYINNLTPNAEYQYRVRSNCDGNDWSEYSASYFHNLGAAQRIAVEPVSETKVYPNPARDVLFVEFDNENNEQVNITIIDGLGKTIQSSMNNADNGTQQIDISQIPNGYYFISIQKENSVETLKFLKVN